MGVVFAGDEKGKVHLKKEFKEKERHGKIQCASAEEDGPPCSDI